MLKDFITVNTFSGVGGCTREHKQKLENVKKVFKNSTELNMLLVTTKDGGFKYQDLYAQKFKKKSKVYTVSYSINENTQETDNIKFIQMNLHISFHATKSLKENVVENIINEGI